MGISGLTTFISDHEELYLKPFELQNTYLVIDGNALSSKLYLQLKKSNCRFGGDYDRFAKNVRSFFDNLENCKVVPLVILDGGYENKRLRIAQKRSLERIKLASQFNKDQAKNPKFFPIFITETFKDIMNEKGVRYVQTLFEADQNIASVAKILKCPVLSSDSDFYVYDVKYIPIDTIVQFPVTNRRKTISCKIYVVENLLQQFKGLSRSVLPLAATLLGNDYVTFGRFEKFYTHLMSSVGIDNQKKQERIPATFKWLSQCSLEVAIPLILSTIPIAARKDVLEMIETVINVYTKFDPEILVSFGFSKESVAKIPKPTPYKFQDPAETGKKTEEAAKESEKPEDRNDPEFEYDLNIQKVAPSWFIDEFKQGEYSSYFIDILAKRRYYCPSQVENYFYPGAIEISTMIITVISTLLTKDLQEPRTISCFCRIKGKELTECLLEPLEESPHFELPNLFNLRNLPLNIRKQILDETLCIPGNAFDSCPEEWKLYLATAVFWMKQPEEPARKNAHLFALLCGILLNVTDSKIGRYRSVNEFEERSGMSLNDVLKRYRNENPEIVNQNQTIQQAYNHVRDEDCLMAVPFFLQNFDVNGNSLIINRNYNLSIVHAFAQFQFCLQHSLNLNALLGCPYEQTVIYSFFNGTFLYNCCAEFGNFINVDKKYVSQRLHSPSLFQLFKVILEKIQEI